MIGRDARNRYGVRVLVVGVMVSLCWPMVVAAACGAVGVQVQVLGTISAATHDVQSSSSYLIWVDGKARVLVNAGADSATSFTASGARVADLDIILFTQLDVANTGDFPWLIQQSLPEKRSRPLAIYGPDRGRLMPSTVTFVRTLFDSKRGVYRYLGDLLDPLGKRTYKLQPKDVTQKRGFDSVVYRNNRLRITAATLAREPLPALAWRIEVGEKSMVFSGDGAADLMSLGQLARKAHLLIVARNTDDVATSLQQAPAVAALTDLASEFGVDQLAFAGRPLPQAESDKQALPDRRYRGRISSVAPMDCLSP